MKDEVPPALIDAHVKTVEKAVSEGKEVGEDFGLDQTGIAGTVPEKEDSGAQEKKDEDKEKKEDGESKENKEQSEEKVSTLLDE